MPPAFGSVDHAQGTLKKRRVDGTRLATIQRAFDIFVQLDSDKDNTLGVDDLERGLKLFDTRRKFTRQEVERSTYTTAPIFIMSQCSLLYFNYFFLCLSSLTLPLSLLTCFFVSRVLLPAVFRTADTTKSGRLQFGEFYSIFACLVLLESKFGLQEKTFLTPLQVKSALLEAGLNPSDIQLEHMFHVKGGSPQKSQNIDFHQILRIYLAAPRTEVRPIHSLSYCAHTCR